LNIFESLSSWREIMKTPLFYWPKAGLKNIVLRMLAAHFTNKAMLRTISLAMT
jgi:hypothetical protein